MGKIIVTVILLALVLGALPASAQLKKFRLSATSIAVTELQFRIALLKGFYRDEGLDVEIVLIRGAVAMQALLGGSVDYTSAAGSIITAAARIQSRLIGPALQQHQLVGIHDALKRLELLAARLFRYLCATSLIGMRQLGALSGDSGDGNNESNRYMLSSVSGSPAGCDEYFRRQSGRQICTSHPLAIELAPLARSPNYWVSKNVIWPKC